MLATGRFFTDNLQETPPPNHALQRSLSRRPTAGASRLQPLPPMRRVAALGPLGGNFARSVMFNHQTMKTLASSLLFLTIASFATAADSLALKDIAGDYYFGDGLGVNCSLTVTAKGKFAFQWNGCLGTYDTNEGTASIKEGILHISPQKPNLRDGFRGTPTEFYPVRWGARLYLIPTNDIVEFCSDFNQGSEPRTGNRGQYYLRRSDADNAVSGKPGVPEQWNKFFLEQPVRGKITELVGKQEAWLDKGSADGLLEGMILTAQRRGDLMFAQVRVEAVEKGRCRIKCQWRDSKLAVGQTVS